MTVVDRRRPDISLDLPRERPAFAQYLTKSSAVENSAVVNAISVINGGHKDCPERKSCSVRQMHFAIYQRQQALDKGI